MYTSMAIEINKVIGILLTYIAKLEAGQPLDPHGLFTDVDMSRMIEDLDRLQRMQLALVNEDTHAARRMFHHLDTDTRNIVSTDAETFSEYVLENV